jgi:hypothetical protein
MNWQRQLKADERELKALIDKLGDPRESGTLTGSERDLALRALSEKLAATRSFVDDFMSGRSEHEKAILSYKLRIAYPLYSHLASLSTLPREYVEWSCAAECETAAAQ